jgi:UDP-N-acetylglucosamine/UDP-N-acetylgalactosamine diphosphorylase
VALLEVKREEEFAPIKNAVGPGVADSAATACDLLLALHQKVCSFPTLEKTTEESLLLKAYAGGVP